MALIDRPCQINGCKGSRPDRTWYDDDYCPKTNSFRCNDCEDKDLDNGSQDSHYIEREFKKRQLDTRKSFDDYMKTRLSDQEIDKIRLEAQEELNTYYIDESCNTNKVIR